MCLRQLVFRRSPGWLVRPAALATLLISGLVAPGVKAAPIGLMERFALAEDREAILAELIPGTEDYFFYHCLHYQNTTQLDRSASILKQWVDSRRGQMHALLHSMMDRQRLLTYGVSPQETIDYFINRLGIQLHHSAPTKKGARRYPSQFDNGLIDLDKLVESSLRDNVKLSPIGMQIAADWYLQGQDSKTRISLRDFLRRIDGPYLTQLDQLVIKELKARRPRDQRFGDISAHQFLTLEELNSVGDAVPAVRDDEPYVHAKLRMLRPSGEVDMSQQPDELRDYLVRLEAYVRTLPASFNSLKASSIFRLLEANLKSGVWDRDLFMRYLQLPRRSGLLSREMVAAGGNQANLNQDFTSIAILSPVGNEQPTVETYLEHFLRDEKDTRAFQKYVKSEYLTRVFARTKLMSGATNPKQYYDMLSASERQQLRDHVQLSFAPNNPSQFGVDQTTKLLADLKNIDKLVVRIYELNSLAYYRANEKLLDSDVDLDGLIATHERTLQYDRPQVERHRESIALPEVSGRGVWIVDLVGKGLRARSIIRRGDLQTVRSSDASGMRLTVLDESRQPVSTARLIVGNQEFTSNDDGLISLPMVSKAVQRKAILTDGKIAKPLRFQHLEESYTLHAGIYLDRSMLQSGGIADVLIRPRLALGQTVVDPATLEDALVRIVAQDIDGIETTKQYGDLALNQHQELVLAFRIPARLARLSISLSGHVTGLTDRRQRDLSTEQTIQVAGIRKTVQTADAFLTRNGEDYVIETRGRSGEILPATTVKLQFLTDAGEIRPTHYVQSDERGIITLGSLQEVRQLIYGVSNGAQHQFDFRLNQQVWPSSIHLAMGHPLRLPLVEGRPAESYRLLELRDGKSRSDFSNRLAVKTGFLTASKLPEGDYRLVDRRTGKSTLVAVVDGPEIDRVLVGKIRHHDRNLTPELSIESISPQQDGSLRIQLAGDTSMARVHLIASRYFDDRSVVDLLAMPMQSLTQRRVSLGRCGYVSDLRLGEEYEYVLRRRYAEKFPGVMLPQPSILLNPWETETTSNDSRAAAKGEAPAASAAQAPEAMRRQSGGAAKSAAGLRQESDYDFLTDSGVLLANLEPDADGRLVIPADAIGGMPLVQVVVADPVSLMRRTVALELPEIEPEDLRLRRSLPLDQSLTFHRTVSVVTPAEPLDFASLGSAQVQVYGSVGSLLAFYRTMINDDRLDEFQVLGRWHTLSTEQKLIQYSELASHEFHLFLFMYDQEFFDTVIRPYLVSKKDKQFIDHWLLGDDLSEYATLWKYQKLGAAEKALLAIRVPALSADIRRDLFEQVALLDQEHSSVRMQIESALRSEVMDFSRPEEMEELAIQGNIGGMAGGGFAFGATSAPSSGAVVLHDMEMDGVADMNQWMALEARGGSVSRRLGRQKAMLGKKLDVSGDKQRAAGQVFYSRNFALGDQLGFYQDLGVTKQWAECNWDRVRVVGGTAPGNLFPINAFWNDLAQNDQDRDGYLISKVSDHLLRPSGNRHEALVALAMCGLPLEAGEISFPVKPETIYRPEHAVALVTKRLKKLEAAEGDSSVLIGQLFRRHGQPIEKGQAPVEPDRFETGVAYQGQVVVSNPTPNEQLVELFWQIPAGSLPLGGSQVTDSKTIRLAPFAVSSVQYHFYFPTAGNFAHYPATVSRSDALLARAKEKSFQVLEEWTDNRITWPRIAREGSAEQIDSFLQDANLRDLNWSLVLHRLRDKAVYDVVIGVMKSARLPEASVWAYGFHHRDEESMRHFLSLRSDLISRCGPVLNSVLLSIDSIRQHQYEHLEYAPLVRARIHRLGKVDEILNPTFLGQYQQFTRRLGFQRSIDNTEKMPLVYYLLLQNRISEAVAFFNSIDRDRVPTKLQHDYLAGYLAMHQGDYDLALEIAEKHKEHPVPRWKTRFAAMNSQVRQRFELMDSRQLVSVEGQKSKAIDDLGIASGAADLAMADRDRANSQASAAVPEVIARIEDNVIRIDHRNTDQVDVNLYGVDLELLFSKAPFARKDLQRIAMVRPTQQDTVTLKSKTGTARYPIPASLRSETLLVEASVGASRSTALYYGGELTTYVSEGFGQLQTTDAQTRRPVAGAYVKVYARYPNGNVRFFKDGYTDGRGRFDYTSISAADAKGAERYAILVLSDEKGASLHDVAAP